MALRRRSLAMIMPTDLRPALNGPKWAARMVVLTATNMANTHIYVTTADRDRFYPLTNGADVLWPAGPKFCPQARVIIFQRGRDQYPAIFDYLNSTRDFSPYDRLETAVAMFGVCKWLG
jgi:hypothetical protein